jgi:uncharacterized membrane protein
MDTSVTNANPADYANAVLEGDWRGIARLAIGGTLIAAGLAHRSKLGFALAALGGGIAALNFLPRNGETADGLPTPRKRIVRRAITISKPQQEVYEFWSKPENLERIFPGVDSITPLGDHKWRWKASVASQEIEWETESIVNEPPNRMSWKSVRETPIEQAGSVVFEKAPGDKGTEVQLTVSWLASNAVAGLALPFLGKGTDAHAAETLRRSKQLLETGEISTAQSAA